MRPESALRYDRLAHESGGLADSHRWLIDHVPVESRVLDCGCAGGFLARALVERRRCTVDGIELDPEAATRAHEVCRRVLVGSLDNPEFLESVTGWYDRILFGDILEHLKQPERALEALRFRLAAGGRILVSIPNVAYWWMRWHLLRGRFDYEDSGLLDRSHLRFYTFRSARALLGRAGYRVVEQDFTYRLHIIPVLSVLALRVMRAFPNLFAYQSLLEAEPCRG